MRDASTQLMIRNSSERLARLIGILAVILCVLLLLERFGWVAVAIGTESRREFERRLAYELIAACPEAIYLLSLWWIRQALTAYAFGDLYGPVVPRMLRRVGAMLAVGSCLNVFVVPGLDRLLGMGRGYWIAFDVTGLVLGAIGLSLAVVARVLDATREIKAELDEIF